MRCLLGSIPSYGFGLPPSYGRPSNASEKVSKKNSEHANKNSEEHLRMEQAQDRNSYVLNHLAETVSGEAMMRELQEKRNRYLDRIQQVMKKNEDEIKKKKIDQETLLRDLEIIAQNLLERNEKLDEFFKFKVKIEDDTKMTSKQEGSEESTSEPRQHDDLSDAFPSNPFLPL